jgi:predicted N-formylglutamate amidohydrolase
LPRRLGSLGLSQGALASHIAWDIGIAKLGIRLAAALDALLILQTYSRLVIDCNRPLGSAESIVASSAGVEVPGNGALSESDATTRAALVFHPYHDAIQRELDRRDEEGQPTILVALHSFTPNFSNVVRPWHAGVLYHHDDRLAAVMLELLREEPRLVVGENEPYAASEQTDFTIIEHAERQGRLHVELEVRQDLLADERGQAKWAERFARLLALASGRFRV